MKGEAARLQLSRTKHFLIATALRRWETLHSSSLGRYKQRLSVQAREILQCWVWGKRVGNNSCLKFPSVKDYNSIVYILTGNTIHICLISLINSLGLIKKQREKSEDSSVASPDLIAVRMYPARWFLNHRQYNSLHSAKVPKNQGLYILT